MSEMQREVFSRELREGKIEPYQSIRGGVRSRRNSVRPVEHTLRLRGHIGGVQRKVESGRVRAQGGGCFKKATADLISGEENGGKTIHFGARDA